MVKSKPRIPDRASRRLLRFESRQKSHHRALLKLAYFSSAPPKNPQSNSETCKCQKTPGTPSSLSMRRRIKFMKRSRSSPSSSISPSSFSCSSSSPKISLSPLNFTAFSSPTSKTETFANSVTKSSSVVDPTTPENSPLPPLPPRPSPEFLRRTVSDPVNLLPLLSPENGFSPQISSPSPSPSRPVSRNLMTQLPSSPSSLLRRTSSDPVSLQCSTSKEENEKGKPKEHAVAAEKLSGEWIVVKFSCECGKDGHYLVNASDKKYYKLI